MKRSDVTKLFKSKGINPSEYGIENTINAANNGLVVMCENEDKQKKLADAIKEKMGDNVSANCPELKLPRLKMLNVELNENETEAEYLKNALKELNEPLAVAKSFDILRVEKMKRNGTIIKDKYNIVISADPKTYNWCMTDGRLKHYMKLYRVVDGLHVSRCYKCASYTHKANDCKKKLICFRCGNENHQARDCTEETSKCMNCIEQNRHHKSEVFNTNHSVLSSECPQYQRAIAQIKRSVNYNLD